MPLPVNPTVNQEAVDDDGILKAFRESPSGDRAWVISGDTPITLSEQRPGQIAADYATTADLVATFDATAQTLTANANGALSIDGGNPVVTDLVLVKDQVNPARRYIYEVQDVGSATTPWSMKVWEEFNESSEVFDGAKVYVKNGTENVNKTFAVDVAEPFVFGGSAINWTVTGSVSPNEIGRGNALPADNSEFQLFILEGHAGGLPDGVWFFSTEASQWFES